MKKFRVSGFIDEVGPSQVDVVASNEVRAKKMAINIYGFYQVVNVTEIN